MIKKYFTITFLLSLTLYSNNINKKIDLTSKTKDIKILDNNISVIEKKTKEDYQKKDDLLKPIITKDKKITKEKVNDITVNSDVDFNKSEKTVDGVKLNLGTKF